MSVYDSIATWSFLPVSVDQVRDEVLATGAVASITFYEVDVNPAEIAGISLIYKGKPPYSVDEHCHLKVIYSSHLPHEYRRVVICKEILHALDSEAERASTPEKVEKLIHEIVVPQDLAVSLPTRSDRVGLLNALRVLLPRDALSDVRELYQKGEIGEEDVAALAVIPEPFARFALTDEWWDLIDTD